jgi:hypothetical protein
LSVKLTEKRILQLKQVAQVAQQSSHLYIYILTVGQHPMNLRALKKGKDGKRDKAKQAGIGGSGSSFADGVTVVDPNQVHTSGTMLFVQGSRTSSPPVRAEFTTLQSLWHQFLECKCSYCSSLVSVAVHNTRSQCCQ